MIFRFRPRPLPRICIALSSRRLKSVSGFPKSQSSFFPRVIPLQDYKPVSLGQPTNTQSNARKAKGKQQEIQNQTNKDLNSTASLEKIGTLVVKYTLERYLLNTRPQASNIDRVEFIDRYVEIVERWWSSTSEYASLGSLRSYIGDYAVRDLEDASKFVLAFIEEDAMTSSQVQNYLQHADETLSAKDKTDETSFRKAFDFSVFDGPCGYPSLVYEIPRSECFRRGTIPLAKVRSKSDLSVLGRLATSLFSSLKIHKSFKGKLGSNYEPPLDSNLVAEVVRYSNLTKLSEGDSMEFFDRYVGALVVGEYESDLQEYRKWLDRLVDEKFGGGGAHRSPIAVSEKHLRSDRFVLKKPKYFRALLPAQMSDQYMNETLFPADQTSAGDFSSLKDLEELGASALDFHLTGIRLALAGNESDYNKNHKAILKYIEVFINSKGNFIPKAFKENGVDFTGLRYLGLLAISLDSSQFQAFIWSFFKGKWNEKKIKEMTILTLKDELRLLSFPHQKLRKGMYVEHAPTSDASSPPPPTASSSLAIPPIKESSVLARFSLTNFVVIRPWLSTIHTRNGNSHASELEKLSRLFVEYGETCYKYNTQRCIFKLSNPELRPYWPPLSKLLSSSAFKGSVLEKGHVFVSIWSEKYMKCLLQHRHAGSLIESQFCQYIAYLQICQPEALAQWISKLVGGFLHLIESSRYGDVPDLIKGLTAEFRNVTPDLQIIFRELLLQTVEPLKFDVSAVHDGPLTAESYAELGKMYLNYYADKTLLSTKPSLSLSGHISAKEEMLNSICLLLECEQPSVDALADVGIRISEDRDEFGERILSKMREIASLDQSVFSNDLALAEDFPVIAQPGSTQSTSRESVISWDQLPPVSSASSLNRLLAVNFYISRTFLLEQYPSMSFKKVRHYGEICTKYNTLGGNFYNAAIRKHAMVHQHTLSVDGDRKEVAERLVGLLLDRRFLALVIKDWSFHPFKRQDANAEYHSLCRQYCLNSYYALRFYGQAFRQYFGALVNENEAAADQWCEALVVTVFERFNAGAGSEGARKYIEDIDAELTRRFNSLK